MKNYCRVCLFVLGMALFYSCSAPTSNTAAAKYFDVTAFFNGQVEKLSSDSMLLVKTSSINGNSDQHLYEWVDWKREFALFYNSDINKPAFTGKYFVDTTMVATDSTHKKLLCRYVATDSSLRTRRIELTFIPQGTISGSDSILKVHMVNRTATFFSTNDEDLNFLPAEGYVIHVKTTNRFWSDNEFAMQGAFTHDRASKYFEGTETNGQ